MNDQVLCLLVTLVLVLFGVWIVLRVDSRRNDQLIAAFVRIKALEDKLDDEDLYEASTMLPCSNPDCSRKAQAGGICHWCGTVCTCKPVEGNR